MSRLRVSADELVFFLFLGFMAFLLYLAGSRNQHCPSVGDPIEHELKAPTEQEGDPSLEIPT